MFEKLFQRPYWIARHSTAPYAEERERYLTACAQRGDSRWTLIRKAEEVYWVACRLSVYGDLHVTLDRVLAAAMDCDWKDRERACGRKLNRPLTRERFVHDAQRWLEYLGYLPRFVAPIPFQAQLERFCRWVSEERGLTEATVNQYCHCVKLFLQWYDDRGRSLSEVQIGDIDAYLAHGSAKGWCRITVSNVAGALRTFFGYGASQGWVCPTLAGAIYAPRIYALEKLPAGPAWSDVQRLLAGLDAHSSRDIRDRAILMLFAIYGLRVKEVARLRLEHLDWEHDLLHIPRVKRRETQIYPLLTSVGNSIIDYLERVRRPRSPHREVFLNNRSPYGPMSGGAMYRVASKRLKGLGIQTAHHGPHSLRHACAARLVADGLSLKEIGDHLGHRTASATRAYAKVDLPSLREVAEFDLGEMS
jgi:integrase/recombinase XerD